MVQRLEQFYVSKIVPQLKEQFNYTNNHQVPILEKIVFPHQGFEYTLVLEHLYYLRLEDKFAVES